MNDSTLDRYGAKVRSVASAFAYPPTPAPRSMMRRGTPRPVGRTRLPLRRLAWLALAALVVVASLLAVPQARAAVSRWIRIGAVRIFLGGPTATGTSSPVTATPTGGVQPSPTEIPATPVPASSLELGDLAGETTLSEARRQAGMEIRLPTYPADLGPPERVFLQDQGGSVVILVWVSPDDAERARLVLQELASESWGVRKMQLESVATTSVSGTPAVWATGPYLMVYRNGELVERRLVEGHTLIWEEGSVTYRLETDLDLREAVRIGESLE